MLLLRMVTCEVRIRLVYRGLDELFRRGKWQDVSVELDRLCDAQYPAAFGIGSLRFASPAASRIPKWNDILGRLVNQHGRRGWT